MAMNYKEVSRRLPEEVREQYGQGINLVNDFVNSLQRQGLLPTKFQEVKPPASKGVLPIVEQPVEVQRFTSEAREVLANEGYKYFYVLEGSIRSYREAGRLFWTTWHAEPEYTDFENKPAQRIEVAINPDPEKFLLPGSNRKTFEEQMVMVKKFSQDLSEELKREDVKAILGEAPDYVSLTFQHLDETGEQLFGEKYIKDGYWSYTRTQTRVGSVLVNVGSFGAGGLFVGYWRPDGRDGTLWAVPLVVPAVNK